MTAALELELPFPSMRYDITLPLLDGRVKIDGVTLKPARIAGMVFGDHPQLRQGDFGLCDLNWGYFLPAIEAGWELIGLPIFCKRKPSYQFIFCRADAGIDKPKELEGKRVGTRFNRTAIPIWCRGLLQHRHGVDLSKLSWVVSTPEVFPYYREPSKVEQAADPRKESVDQLLGGEVDAIVTDISDKKLFDTFESNPILKRLFPNYIEMDEQLYRDTGIYTPMHQMVMSRKLDREYPDLARKIYLAFEEAKRIAYRDVLSDQAGFTVVYLRERMQEQRQLGRSIQIWDCCQQERHRRVHRLQRRAGHEPNGTDLRADICCQHAGYLI